MKPEELQELTISILKNKTKTKRRKIVFYFVFSFLCLCEWNEAIQKVFDELLGDLSINQQAKLSEEIIQKSRMLKIGLIIDRRKSSII